MQIIDFHTHVYPDAIAHKAAQSIRDFYEIGDTNLDGTVDLLLQTGKEAGITRFIILPVGLKPSGVGRITIKKTEHRRKMLLNCGIGEDS